MPQELAIPMKGQARPAFRDFYQSEYLRVLALCRALVDDRTLAEDLCQEAFLSALNRWDSLRDPPRWIRRVAINKARSRWRRLYAERRALLRLATLQREPEGLPPDTEAFWSLVRGLPRRQAQAVALFYVDDLPVSEIASILGCAESTVRVHLMRARKTLARRLQVNDE